MNRKDKFVDKYSLRDWDWYNNGENPNTLEYKTILWNSTVVVDGQKLFTGDLGKDRLKFLIKLSKEQKNQILIFSEYQVPKLFISMGIIYELKSQRDYGMEYAVTKKKQKKVKENPLLSHMLMVNRYLNYYPNRE